MEIDLSNDSSVDGFNRDSIEKKMPNEENEIEETINEADKVVDLIIGTSFNSMKKAHQYYIKYSRQNGFAVAIRTSKKGSDGKLKNVTIICSRGRKPRIKSSCPTRLRPQLKTNCKACINISLRSDERWILNQFVLDHNHSMSPGKSKFYKCNRVLQNHVKRRLELNDKARIRLNKTYNTFAIKAGGHDKLAFLEKDYRNYLDKYQCLQLGEGYAIAMRKYFDKIHADNSNFYYTMDVDEKCRLRNVFWADARSRVAWKEFGDVVTFDTTYLVNKYDMPFAHFIGVNHHGQSILLGCGLISHEDTRSFVWLFESWMTCMSGYAPNAIITDQDQAMKKAIEIVFPHARHRWYLWHILKKVLEKLRGYQAYEDIKTCIHNAVYDSLTPEEFEEIWGVMIKKYQLENNEWLVGLYAERYRWVPAFVKDTFWTGMSTTQRSESMHAYFDGYINSKTTLKQFVEQYGNVLAKKAENESNADFNSFHSYIPCIMDYEFEKQFQNAYTISKFKEFQAEFIGKLRCYLGQCTKDHEFSKYEISKDVFCGDNQRVNFSTRSLLFILV